MADTNSPVTDVKVEPVFEAPVTKTKTIQLISKLNYAVHIPYGDDNICVSPHGRALDLDPAKLPEQLPQGVQKLVISA